MKRASLADLMDKSVTSSRKVTEHMLKAFADASGDFNPIHFDDASAVAAGFKSRIAHGMLISSFVSEVIGMELPGPGSIAKSLNLEFLRPVYLDSTVDIKVEILEITPNHRRAAIKLAATCSVGGKDVIRGEGLVYYPLDEKEV